MVPANAGRLLSSAALKFFWGIGSEILYGYAEATMKEHLQSNIITKHLAGWSTAEEERFIREWLKNNPHHAATYQAIRQHYLQVMARQEVKTL